MPRYRRRPEYVEAIQFTLDDIPDCVTRGQDGLWRVQTSGMAKVIKPGRWIVTDEQGTTVLVLPEMFDRTYEPDTQP